MTPFISPVAILQAQTSALPPFSWSSWSGDGVLRGGLLLLAGVYVLGVGPLRQRFNLGPTVGWGRIVTYLSGVFCLFAVLEGPIHELSDTYLFSAHMVQHMVLVYAAPPLMLLGIPGWLLRPIVRLPGVLPVARFLTHPILAAIAFNLIFSLYHIPLYYNVVALNHNLHIASHLLFIAFAFVTWWPILSPMSELPPLSYPLRLLYVFGQTFSGFLVGSFITNAPTVLYPFYEQAPRTWGLSPLDDQKIGGLIMWVVGGTYLLLVFSAVFFAWARAEGVHDDVAVPVRPRPRPMRQSTPSPVNGATPAAPPPTTVASAPSAAPTSAPVAGERATAQDDPSACQPRRVVGSPTDLGARHVVTSAPDRSRLN